METKKIIYGKKFYEVSEDVHRGYESSTRTFIRNNESFHKNEIPFEKVYPVKNVPFEDEVEDKLLCEEIKRLAKAHLNDDEYIIFRKIILDGESEREYAETLGITQQAVSKRKRKIIEKIKFWL